MLSVLDWLMVADCAFSQAVVLVVSYYCCQQSAGGNE